MSVLPKSDLELVNDARMLAYELAKLHKELKSRCIDACVLTYADGDIKVEYDKVITTPIGKRIS